MKRFGLFHHNVERTDDDLDSMVEECRNRVSEAGVRMECFGVSQKTEFDL